MNFLILFINLFAILTSHSQATEPIVYDAASPMGQLSVHIYSDDSRWRVAAFVIDEDGLPKTIAAKNNSHQPLFVSQKEALSYAKKQYGIKDENINTETFTTPLQQSLPSSSKTFGLSSSSDILWKADNAWSWDMEKKCSAFIKKNLDVDFFRNIGIENDCADIAYQTEIICARTLNLPFAFRLAGGGWLTNETMKKEWKNLKTIDWKKGELDFTNNDPTTITHLKEKLATNLKEDKRLLAVLEYAANNTYTHTLLTTTYPIEINPESLLEGSIYLMIFGDSGHTLIVNEVNTQSSNRLPIYTINSTVPKEVRPLSINPFSESEQPKSPQNGGFRRFRWPIIQGSKMTLVSENKMPHYSLEQYSPNFMDKPDGSQQKDNENARENFSLSVYKRINPSFNPVLTVTEGVKTLSEMIENRKQIVQLGYDFCVLKKNNCAPGTAGDEDWSTPSRDKRALDLIISLDQYASTLVSIQEIQEAWAQALEKSFEIEGEIYKLSSIYWSWKNKYSSSNPMDSVETRWGLAPHFFAKLTERDLTPLLSIRSEKIKSNVCKSSECDLFSPLFDKNSTFVEDAKIKNVYQKYNLYCQNFSAKNCNDFLAEMTNLPTLAKNQSNLSQTWSSISMLGSDPRMSDEERWGDLQSNLVRKTLSGTLTSLSSSKSGYDLITTAVSLGPPLYNEQTHHFVVDRSSGDIVYSTENDKSITNKAEYRGMSIHPEQDFIFSFSQKGAQILSLDGEILATTPLTEVQSKEQYGAIIHWIGKDQVALYSAAQNTLFTFTVTKDSIQKEKVYTELSPGYNDTPHQKTYMQAQEKTATLIVVNRAEIKTHTLAKSDLDLPTNAIFDFETQVGTSILLKATSVNQNDTTVEKFILINTTTGKSKLIAWDSSYYLLKNNLFAKEDYDTKTSKISLRLKFVDEELKTAKTLSSIPGECVNCYEFKTSTDNKLYFNSTDSNSTIYSVDEGNLTISPVATVNDKSWRIATVYNQWITLQNGDLTSLINLKDGLPYLTAHQITFGGIYYSSMAQAPFITVSRGIKIDPKTQVFQNALISLKNLSAPALYTTSSLDIICDPASDACGTDSGMMHDGDHGEEEYSELPTSPIIPLKEKILTVQHSPLEITEPEIPKVVYLSPTSESSFTMIIKIK